MRRLFCGGGAEVRALELPPVVLLKERSYPGIQHGRSMALVPFGGSICSLDLRSGAAQTSLPAMMPYLTDIVHASFAGLKKTHGIAAAGESYLVRNYEDGSDIQLRDSSQLNAQDYGSLLEVVRGHKARVIIIPMGTTKLIECARYLKANLSDDHLSEKLIVFTGAHSLWHNVPGDAQFNLGYALAQRFSNRTGVVVAMHGGVFNPDEILLSEQQGNHTSARISLISREAELRTPIRDFKMSVFSMGGTIEGAESEFNLRFSSGFFKDYLEKSINPRQMPDYLHIASDRDSRELQDHHFAALKANILESSALDIIVPVGTFGAESVAAYLMRDEAVMREITAKSQKILLTVACILPTAGSASDAPANMGFAMGVAPHIKDPGVYLAVNGTVCEPSAVKKVSLNNGSPPFYVPAQFVDSSGELIPHQRGLP